MTRTEDQICWFRHRFPESELNSSRQLAVDRHYSTACPKVLYKADYDRRVFPKISLDQVDQKHVYLAFLHQVGGSAEAVASRCCTAPQSALLCFQIRRVPVSNCGSYTSMRDCWSAQDPYCVWCSSKNRSDEQRLALIRQNAPKKTGFVTENNTFSLRRCTFEEACSNSTWLSIPEESRQRMVSYQVMKDKDKVLLLV